MDETIFATDGGRMTAQHRGWYSRGYLPHCNAPGLIQHLTFHLADSLPVRALTRMQAQLRVLPPTQRSRARFRCIESLLDKGLGSCFLARPDCARIVEDSLLFGDGSRYRLLAWTVMPNHVHVLLEQLPGWSLGKVVQSWKRHTARWIHRVTRHASPLPLWQRDYWDRYIRDDRHLAAVVNYVEMNPVSAGLVETAHQWRWGSARRK